MDLKKEWTGEQIVELLHLLKPSHVNLESVGSKLYLELIKVKSVVSFAILLFIQMLTFF